MFRLKRFRLFLVLAILATVTFYEFTRVKDDLSPAFDLDFILHRDALTSTLVAVPTPPPATPSSVGHDPNTITGEELLAQKPYPDDQGFSQHEPSRLEVEPLPLGQRPRWKPPKQHFPVRSLIAIPHGTALPLPPIQHKFSSESASGKRERIKKQLAVREAFKHAWSGYKTYAYGHDELKPLSNSSADPFNGWGATLIDALDTMWIMGLKDDFNDAVRTVAKIDFKTSSRKSIPLFETTIRYLGGLLAAYDVSDKQHPVLLNKAVELADILMGAFDTPNRMPMPFYQWAPSYTSQRHRASPHIVMAELGTLAMEFTRLSQLTKDHKYYDAIARVTKALEEWQMNTTYPGVWPIKLDASGCKKPELEKIADLPTDFIFNGASVAEPDSNFAKRQLDLDAISQNTSNTGRVATTPANGNIHHIEDDEDNDDPDDHDEEDDVFNGECHPQGLAIEPHSKSQTYGIAAMADSTYEYFPKMHTLLGGLNDQYKSMYKNSMDVIRSDFLFRPMIKEKRDILFLAKQKINPKAKNPLKRKKTFYESTHLGCFVGGMFALGSKVFNIPEDMKLAEKLTDACVWAYESTPLGIMPEMSELVPCEDMTSCQWNESRWHDFLDPLRKERFEAVDQYNQKQEALLDLIDDDSDGHGDSGRSKRDADTRGPAATKTLDVDTFSTAEMQDSIIFQPKTALSHAKYVAARISEERLPPGYTKIQSRQYRLRPEAIESVFIMYRLTGDASWREKGWKMFTAVERATRTRAGHAMVKDVTSSLEIKEDTMESFWLAETLKYYYLLFSEEAVYSLDDWTLNTEAHPFRIPRAGASL